jgi:hypothetical protein
MENLKLRMMKDKDVADGEDEKQEMSEKQKTTGWCLYSGSSQRNSVRIGLSPGGKCGRPGENLKNFNSN